MSKRPFEDLDSRNNIVIVPTVAFPAKKPKLDPILEPQLPPGQETLELAKIPVPPLPLPTSDSQHKPPNIKLLYESDKIDTKTKVISEKPTESSVSTATLNTPATTAEKTSGSEAKQCEPDQSKFPQSRSWASDYLMSIGQIYRKPIKINLSTTTKRNLVSTKESPPKEETNNSVINAREKNTDVVIKKDEPLVNQQLDKDNLQTSNLTESYSTRYATKIENIPANKSPQNILDVPTLSLDYFLANRNETLDPIGEQSEQLAAEKYRTLQAPLNPNDIVYYNYNTSNTFIPHMHITHNTEHDIDYYRYNAHYNYFEHPIHEHHRISHAYKSHYEQGRLANDRSYLDVKIDEFLAKVSRDPPHAYRFDQTKTRETLHKKSLSLKRHATEPRRETRETCRENRDDFIKKSGISEERKYNDMNKPRTKDYDICDKYKDFTQSAENSYVSSKIILGNSREENKTKINIKDDKLSEDSKDYFKNYKKTNKEDYFRDKYKNEESTSKPKRAAIDYADYYKCNKKNDLCRTKNQTESNKRGRRSQSSESSDDSSSQSSEEPKQNKTKRANKRKSSSKDKDKSPFYVSPRSEKYGKNKKTTLINKEKSLKTSSSSNRSRGSEEQECNISKTKREEREKTSNDKEKTFSCSTRRSEKIEHKSKSKQDKERPPSKDKCTFLRETIKQKIRKPKDDIKRLRRQQCEKTPYEVKSKYSHNDKPSTSKQANVRNHESSPEKPMKSIVQVNNNSKLDINEPFDLRSKLSRQNLSQFINKIREENSTIPEKALENREIFFITVANDCNETETVEKSTKKSSKKNKNKKVKKIQLVINVVCEESDTSESEDNKASKETKKTSKEIKKSSSLSAEDLSFLDDLNIDEIVNSLTSTHKDKDLDAPKICTNNVITTNIEEHNITDDDTDHSDASTVHLEEVNPLHSLDDDDQLNKTDSAEKEHKNKLRYNLVRDSKNVPLLEQRSTESLEREKDDAVKIKEEISDMTYCTHLNRRIKETENTHILTTSSGKVDEKAMFKKLFTPMMEMKIEPIEILSDDETPKFDNLSYYKLGDSTLNTTKRSSANISEIQTKENVTKDSKTTQNKTETLKTLNVSSPLPVPEVPMTIKSEFTEIVKNTAPANNGVPSTSDQITHSLVEIKEEPKEIAEKLTASLKTNISEKTTKASRSTRNILKDNMPQSEIKIEPEETISHEEVSLEMNTKANCAATKSKRDVSIEVEDRFKFVQDTDACANSDRGNTEYSNITKTSNSKSTNRNSEQAVTDMASNKSHILSESASVRESQKNMNQDLDKGITDFKKKTNETMKEYLVEKHLLETQTKKDNNNEEISFIKEQSKGNEQTRITTKDASNINSSSKTSDLNIKSGLLTPKASSLSPANASKGSTAVSIPISLTPANNPQKISLLSDPKIPSPAIKTATVLSTPKSATSASNLQKTNLLSVTITTVPVNAPFSVISTATSSIPANNPQKTNLLPVPNLSSVNSLKTPAVLSTPKSETANNPQKTIILSAPKSTVPVNALSNSVIPTATSSIPANNPQKTNLLSVPNQSSVNILKSTVPVNAPSTSVISTATSSIPANNPQKTNLLPVLSQSPANTFKTTTVLSTPKSVTSANNPQNTSLPVPKGSKVNTPNISNSLPYSKDCSANSKASTSPEVNSKPVTVNIKTSTPSPVPQSSATDTSAYNPEINDANGKPLRPSEKTFLDDNLKPRMQQYLKTSYNITQLIHRGRFSKILKCSDDQGNEMAVKVLREKCDRYEMGVLKETMLEELQKDICEDNLHFVRLHDGFAVGNQWTFLMDYYPKNLNQALAESAIPFHIDRVQQLSRQLVTAVAVLRNNNIVHSDIKPHHLLLNSTNDRIKLCGFDQAYYGQRKPLPNIGSVNYRAPEIILGYSTGFSIDVWSTALVMYEMATKLQLFPGTYNNDILFKQICTLGFIPIDMLRQSQFACRHFDDTIFKRRQGEKGQGIAYLSEGELFKNNKLLGTIRGVYHLEWGYKASRKQKQHDLTKLHKFQQLLQQMLVIHPKHRLPIEFAYASRFLLDVFT